jgi:hypothetical protein
MSWVMNSTLMPVSRAAAIRARISRLGGDVERGGRFVGDQHARAQASAMAIITRWRMPARQLVRVLLQAPRRFGDPDLAEQRQRLAPAPAVEAAMEHHGLGQLVADGEHRVQRRHRLLKDHRDLGAADARISASDSAARSTGSSPRRSRSAARAAMARPRARSGAGATAP